MNKTDGIIRREFKKVGKRFDLDIYCEVCGDSLGLDPDFGMDCKNGCQKKLFKKLMDDFIKGKI